MQTNDELLIMEIDNRYKLLKCIQADAFSKTYLATDMRINMLWAITVCDKRTGNTPKAVQEIIIREAKTMSRLENPAIPRVVDIIDKDRYLFIVKDYIAGETLSELLKWAGAQSEENVVNWAKQLCEVLQYLHTLTPPHIHRDIKPANIMLTPDGKIKLIGFEIVHLYDPKKDCDEMSLGTRGYAAPEQYGGKGQSDWRTDIYALGVTMAQLVTGVDPCMPDFKLQPIRNYNPNLSRSLEKVIIKCTKENPKERYQSCEELLRALNRESAPLKNKGLFRKIFQAK